MKQKFSWLNRHKMLSLYVLALVLWVVYALVCAGWDALGFATGRLHTETLALSDLALQDIVQDEAGNWVTAGGDPQLQLTLDQPVRSVTFATDAPASGFEGYYGRAGQDASLRRRVWAEQSAPGTVTLVFPMGSGTARIDPAGSEGVVLGAADAAITVNAPLPLWQYFRPLGEQALALAVLPAVLAALWDLLAFWAARLRR